MGKQVTKPVRVGIPEKLVQRSNGEVYLLAIGEAEAETVL
jgi:hypothetical protein